MALPRLPARAPLCRAPKDVVDNQSRYIVQNLVQHRLWGIFSRRRVRGAVSKLVGTVAALAVLAGCGPSPDDFPADDHLDVLVAATGEGTGDLAADYHSDEPIPVFLSASLGGFDLYSASDPGFALLEEEEPDEGLFVVADDVEVALEITALDEGVRLKVGEVTLDEVGDSAVLGTTPEVHTHGEWQVVVPTGISAGTYALSFRFTTSAPEYGPSETITVVLELSQGDPEAEE